MIRTGIGLTGSAAAGGTVGSPAFRRKGAMALPVPFSHGYKPTTSRRMTATNDGLEELLTVPELRERERFLGAVPAGADREKRRP
jgi:hypothetical protein